MRTAEVRAHDRLDEAFLYSKSINLIEPRQPRRFSSIGAGECAEEKR